MYNIVYVMFCFLESCVRDEQNDCNIKHVRTDTSNCHWFGMGDYSFYFCLKRVSKIRVQ